MKERYSSFIPPSNPHLCPIPRAQREVHVLGIDVGEGGICRVADSDGEA